MLETAAAHIILFQKLELGASVGSISPVGQQHSCMHSMSPCKRTWFLYDFRATVESLRVTGGLPPPSRPLLTSPPSVRDGDSELDLAELMEVRHEMF